ncbi:hypothetical protein FACS1894178_1560 [Bacteroidia bacterium]|nr:hypothetical protein FACS1894178_1560 [Bacteroidia bacterium]
MKTNLLKLTAFLLILIGSISCQEKELTKAYSIQEGRIDINENEFISMQILPENLFINSTIALTIENHTEGVLQYGYEFSLKYLDKVHKGCKVCKVLKVIKFIKL